MLDKKDWKILSLLSHDSRIPLTKLATKTGVSREVANYRIKRLVKTGVIQSFFTEIDLAALGYTKHVVYLELKNATKHKEKEILHILENNPFVSWLVTSTGKWSVIFDIHSRNVQHLSQLMNQLKNDLLKFFGQYELVTLERYRYFHSKFFGEEDPIEKEKKTSAVLDEVDLSILKELRNNARIDYVKLSHSIGLTPEAISKRIRRLKANNVIKKFSIFPNLAQLGFEHYNVQINLENVNADGEREIMTYLKNHKSVSFIYEPISHWDIEFGVFVKNPGELRDFMMDFRTQYPERIRIKDISLFYEELLPNYLPKGVFEQ